MRPRIKIENGPPNGEWQELVEKIAEAISLGRDPFQKPVAVTFEISTLDKIYKVITKTAFVQIIITFCPVWYGGIWSFRGSLADGRKVRGVYTPLRNVSKGYIEIP